MEKITRDDVFKYIKNHNAYMKDVAYNYPFVLVKESGKDGAKDKTMNFIKECETENYGVAKFAKTMGIIAEEDFNALVRETSRAWCDSLGIMYGALEKVDS